MFEKDEDYRKARKESKDRITKVIKVWSAREETLHDEGFQKGAEFGYNKANEWHLLKDGYPEVDKLVRVRTFSGMEHICEVTLYYPDEDEIGYGSAIISFYELNGEWIDDNDIKSWCELQPVPKEFE